VGLRAPLNMGGGRRPHLFSVHCTAATHVHSLQRFRTASAPFHYLQQWRRLCNAYTVCVTYLYDCLWAR